MLKQLRIVYFSLLDRYVRSPFEEGLAARVARGSGSGERKENILAVEAVEDPFYFSLFGDIVAASRCRAGLQVDQLVVRSLRVGSTTGLAAFMLGRLRSNALTDRKWIRLYSVYCDHVADRARSNVAKACR